MQLFFAASGSSWDGLWAVLEASWTVFGSLGAVLGGLGGQSWGYLGPILGGLGPFCGGHDRLGWPWCHLENQASQRTIVLLSLSLSPGLFVRHSSDT